MKNWQELGEVPDSDDEFGFDNFSDPDTGATGPSVSIVETQSRNIWEIPSSKDELSARACRQNPTEQHSTATNPVDSSALSAQSSPLTPLPPEFDANNLESPLTPQASRIGSGFPHHLPLEESHQSSGRHQPPSDLFSSSTFSKSAPESHEQEDQNASAKAKDPPANGSPIIEIVLPSGPVPGQLIGVEYGEESDRQAALRVARSLRPRKPIQEHPYLLENAQYSKVMRSHGFRPEKHIEAPSPKRKPAEKDSQDEEFSQDRDGNTAPISSQESLDHLATGFAAYPEPPRLRASHLCISEAPDESENDQLPSLSQLRKSPQAATPFTERVYKGKSSPVRATKRRKSLKIPKPLSQPPSVLKRPCIPVNNCKASTNEAFSPIKACSDLVVVQETKDTPHSEPRDSSPVIIRQPGRLGFRNAIREVTPTRTPSTSMPMTVNHPIDLTADGEDSEASSDGSSRNSSGSEIVRKVGKRIRGVLPASWLRLDEAKNHLAGPRGQSHIIRNAHTSPEKTRRKGVAQRRQGPSKSSSFILDLSDDDNDNDTVMSLTPNTISSTIPRGSDHRQDERVDGWHWQIVAHGDDSDMEEDVIDAMLGLGKRASTARTGPRKRRKIGPPGRIQGITMKQAKITRNFIRRTSGKAGLGTGNSARKCTSSRRKTQHGSPRGNPPLSTPQLLSIVDVAEPGDPKFIRLAARTARQRSNQGKASPNRKCIQLATRADNVDALSVLRDWKENRIKPRTSARVMKRGIPTATRQPLGPKSMNQFQRQPCSKLSYDHINGTALYAETPLKTSKKQMLNGFVERSQDSVNGPHSKVVQVSKKAEHLRACLTSGRGAPVMRPAILETQSAVRVDRQTFGARKLALDALFSNQRQICGFSPINGHGGRIAHQISSQPRPRPDYSPCVGAVNVPKRSRFRKRYRPRRIDLDDPKYSRANDPLPETSSIVIVEPIDPKKNKLGGLGPYGLSYTHHFEVFPLDFGVFFHSSTLIGSGRLRRACQDTAHGYFQARPSVSFSLDQKIIRWSVWNETTSSELGILVDWCVDKLRGDNGSGLGWEVTSAATFVVEYIQDAMSFTSPEARNSFISRFKEVIGGFLDRTRTISRPCLPATLTRVLLAGLAVLKLCRKDTSLFTESIRLEDMVKDAAIQLTGHLVSLSTEKLSRLYQDLQDPVARERGIRSNDTVPEGWVVLMHSMAAALIPRVGFWDIVSEEMLGKSVMSCLNAQVLEEWWKLVFILLPLGEVDNAGILISRRRFHEPLEGWQIPLQILKRVFTLYRANTRQSPSFNSYMAGLMSRCHYLASQWGWKNLTSVIGTIFDFFGGIELHHLRNEQVTHSPKFLDALAAPITVDSGDCVFHIFLKLLEATLRRLTEDGKEKETKNLIARIIPNHNRHFDREHSLDLRDLASLQNHHDLLCTIFLSVPSTLRPPSSLIQDLVSPDTAHKQAFLINIGAWKRLATFLVREIAFKPEGFEPLAKWYRDMYRSATNTIWLAASDLKFVRPDHKENTSTKPLDPIFQQHYQKNLKTATSILLSITDAGVEVLGAVNDMWEFTTLFELVPSSMVIDQILDEGNHNVLKKHPRLAAALASSVLKPLAAYFDSFIQPVLDGLIDADSLTSPFGGNYKEAFVSECPPLFTQLSGLTRNQLRHHGQYFMRFWEFSAFLLRTVGELGNSASPVSSELSQLSRQAATLCGYWVSLNGKDISGLLSRLPSGFITISPLAVYPVHELPCSERRGLIPFMVAALSSNPSPHSALLSLGLQVLMTALVMPKKFWDEDQGALPEKLWRQHPLFSAADPGLTFIETYNDAHVVFLNLIRHMSSMAGGAEAFPEKKTYRDGFAPAVSGAMCAMKRDIQNFSLPEGQDEFRLYVQKIVGLIREYGHDLGVEVDEFFLNASEHYSPDPQDPNLLGPVLDRYVKRLENGTRGTETQLFYFLYNSYLGLRTDSAPAKQPVRMDAVRNFSAQVAQRIGKTRSEGSLSFFKFFIGTFLPAAMLASDEGECQATDIVKSFEESVSAMRRTTTSLTHEEFNTWEQLNAAVIGLLWRICTKNVAVGRYEEFELEILGLCLRLSWVGRR